MALTTIDSAPRHAAKYVEVVAEFVDDVVPSLSAVAVVAVEMLSESELQSGTVVLTAATQYVALFCTTVALYENNRLQLVRFKCQTSQLRWLAKVPKLHLRQTDGRTNKRTD